MTRLFVSLYLLVLIASFTFILGLNPSLEYLLRGESIKHTSGSFGVVFSVLDNELKHSEDKNQALAEIKAAFKYEIDLIDMATYDPNNKESAEITKYGASERTIDDTIYFYVRSKTFDDSVWKMQVESSDFEENHDLVIGPIRILEKQLRRLPESEWQAAINDLIPNQQYPIGFIKNDSVELTKLGKKYTNALNTGRAIGFDVDTNNERYYYQFSGTDKVLKVGPLKTPEIVSFLIYLISAFAAIFLATVILLWVRPLWKNINALDTAAREFGKGNFEARAQASRFSPIKPLSINFNKMVKRVQSLISSHKDLTNAVSHELRTPLARMRFSLEMLQNADNTEERKHFATEMATDIEELDSLVNELLTYARFERSNPDIELGSYHVIPWLQEQITRAQKLNGDIDISLHHRGVPTDQIFNFENRLLARALSNLLRNGLQHAEQEVHVILQMNDKGMELSVEDDGPGIPFDSHEKIFDPFTRVDQSRNRNSGGFGIGLAIVKQVAEWHNAEIAIETSVLGGAKFVMFFPTS